MLCNNWDLAEPELSVVKQTGCKTLNTCIQHSCQTDLKAKQRELVQEKLKLIEMQKK